MKDTEDMRRALHPQPSATGFGWKPLTPDELSADLPATHAHFVIQADAPRMGGMGAVYRALDASQGDRPVAIKVIRRDKVDIADFTERFRREEKTLRTLDHPNIVHYHTGGQTTGGYPFIVMDWLEGRSLADFTRLDSTRDKQTLLGYFRDICAAVAHAHAARVPGGEKAGILHRDLKPANIIITPEGRAIVLDWGIACPLDPARTRFTVTGDTPGTRGYIAPEIEAGAKPDETADIYSLGIHFYQLFMKRLPSPTAARPSEEGMDPAFDTIFRKAAAERKEDRYKSVDELLEAVNEMARSGAHGNPPECSSLHHIEINDEAITINGKRFDTCPKPHDITRALGCAPEKFDSFGWGKDYSYYIWHEAGVFATTVDHRVQELQIWFGDGRPKMVMCSVEPETNFERRSRSIDSPYRGTISLWKSSYKNDSGIEDIQRFRPGPPLKLQRWSDGTSGIWSSHGESCYTTRERGGVSIGLDMRDGAFQGVRFGWPDLNIVQEARRLFPIDESERLIYLCKTYTYQAPDPINPRQTHLY